MSVMPEDALSGTTASGIAAADEATNTYSAADIKVVKTGETTREVTQVKIPGAKFKLYKLNETDDKYGAYPDSGPASCEKETID